jgi:hypothetical protein
MTIESQVQALERYAATTNQCPHLPQLITYWDEQADGTLIPGEPMISDAQREQLSHNPMHDASLECSCGRRRMEFKIVHPRAPESRGWSRGAVSKKL